LDDSKIEDACILMQEEGDICQDTMADWNVLSNAS
jgi:hypothetical protein